MLLRALLGLALRVLVLLAEGLKRKLVNLQKKKNLIPDVSQKNGGISLRRGDTNGGLNNPSKGGCLGSNIGWLVTWEFPLCTDSASWKSWESFIQFTLFCNSCNLPDKSMIVFWSSMSFCLLNVSKVELWSFRNSSTSISFCWSLLWYCNFHYILTDF